MAVKDFNELPIYKENKDLSYNISHRPLPVKKGLPYKLNDYSDVDEPKFDPLVHLDLGAVGEVYELPQFHKVHRARPGKLAFAKPIRVLSNEGVRIINQIADRENDNPYCPSRGTRVGIRGLYYSSPFIRDFVTCPQLQSVIEEVAGEKLILAPIHNSTPQVNISGKSGGKGGAVEHWHWDSVAYVTNIQLSNMEGMEGGDLEVILMDKYEGMEALTSHNLDPASVKKISYEAPGNLLVAQGSEILHHVTPVTSSHVRSVLICCWTPANVLKPDKTVLATEMEEDKLTGAAKYEFFRNRAWTCSNVLKAIVEKVEYTADGDELGRRLRSVSHELLRAASLLEEKTSDAVGYFNENTGKHDIVYNG